MVSMLVGHGRHDACDEDDSNALMCGHLWLLAIALANSTHYSDIAVLQV